MSVWSRMTNVFRGDRLIREIDEELQAHIDDAIAAGRDPEDARRAFGHLLRQREASRDVRLAVWLDSLRADAVFGWRQLQKNKVSSTAAVLSLALAIGASTSAFRLVDALLLRPLPIAAPERLYALVRPFVTADGKPATDTSFEYPVFARMRAAVKDQAELMAASNSSPAEIMFGSDQEGERVTQQYVSGWMFPTFGLRPAAGRLFTESDDLKPGGHPYAVLGYDYWTRRFGRDPKAIGKTFRFNDRVYEIVGVLEKPFNGVQPGSVPAIYMPVMMHGGMNDVSWGWAKTFVQLKPGVSAKAVLDRLAVAHREFQEYRAKGWPAMSKHDLDQFIQQPVALEPAASGASFMQREYGRALWTLGALVALVLLIACANVANLMTARAAMRTREMALRVSIGAGRRRLIQLVLVESAWIALLAASLGAAFAWRAAPFVASRINPPDHPTQLVLPADWRVLGFGLLLALCVTCLFGLGPALRASSVRPASALKGGDDPHARRRSMNILVAAQAAFCFVVLFMAGLFLASFKRLSSVPTGFSADRVLVLDTLSRTKNSPELWEQAVAHLRAIAGVESAAYAGFALLTYERQTGPVAAPGLAPSGKRAYFLDTSPNWLSTMNVKLLDGRDFRPGDVNPGMAIVNETFVREFLGGDHPVGKWFERADGDGSRIRFQVIGLAADARYHELRGPVLPVAYVPFAKSRVHAVLLVKTTGANPRSMSSLLRQEVTRGRPELRVANVITQQELNDAQSIRERLLALLAAFFGGVALLLAAVGLYGVLDYSVLQRRKEIGIRMALGARAAHIARSLTSRAFSMVFAGSLAGFVLAMAGARFIESLLFQVGSKDAAMITAPSLTILAAAALAALPAIARALHIDPVEMLRSE